MEFKTHIIPACEFLHTTAKGELDFPRAKAILRQAIGGEKHESAEILLDFREATPCGPLSPSQIWNLVQMLEDRPSQRWRRMALLLSREAPGTAAALFELSATNRGFPVAVFHDFEEALYWLARPRNGHVQES
jgi:hypothetical protein